MAGLLLSLLGLALAALIVVFLIFLARRRPKPPMPRSNKDSSPESPLLQAAGIANPHVGSANIRRPIRNPNRDPVLHERIPETTPVRLEERTVPDNGEEQS